MLGEPAAGNRSMPTLLARSLRRSNHTVAAGPLASARSWASSQIEGDLVCLPACLPPPPSEWPQQAGRHLLLDRFAIGDDHDASPPAVGGAFPGDQ